MNWTQIFQENLNCYALSIFRVFILLPSSDSDKHMLKCKQRFAYTYGRTQCYIITQSNLNSFQEENLLKPDLNQYYMKQ